MDTYGKSENTFNYGNVVVFKETEKAILVVDDDSKEFWIPKSQISDDSEVWEKDQKGDLVVKEYWAVHEGWI